MIQRRYLPLEMLYSSYLLCQVSRLLHGFLERAAARDILAVSNAEMGWILFGLSVGSIIGLLSASHFIDGKGARDVIIGSMFFMIVGLLCLGITIYFVSSMGLLVAY